MWRNTFKLRSQYSIGLKSLRRSLATNTPENQSYFGIFLKTFPHGGPPKESFIINLKQLRKEYRVLQSEHHPDVSISQDDFSSIVNKAYTTLKNPYTRVAYIIEKNHPGHLDITKDEVAKDLIKQFQGKSTEVALAYKTMLMSVLDAHEALELAELEKDLDELSVENDERLEQSETKINDLLATKEIPWDDVVMEAIKIKYWVNIQNGIKDWEQGKPVHLTH